MKNNYLRQFRAVRHGASIRTALWPVLYGVAPNVVGHSTACWAGGEQGVLAIEAVATRGRKGAAARESAWGTSVAT
ncbi:MAG: hypothetical protein IJV22_08145 [Bacteroidales bacterium]|nr:hypothetical protein [Bacteroidales bacterium]